MEKIIFNTRDELVCVDVDMVAVVIADGNYSRLFYIDRKEIHLTFGISSVEKELKGAKSAFSRFVRLGRSLIINHSYLGRIDLLRQQLTLTDFKGHELRINMSRNLIRTYKKAVMVYYNSQKKQ